MASTEPTPPPEAQTEAEKTAYCAGWWAALEAVRTNAAEPQHKPGCALLQLPARECDCAVETVQEPETVDQRVVPLVESALQAVAEKIGDQCAVWHGIGARDVEEVLREAARHGLVRGALAEPVQEHDLSRCPKCGGPADNGHDREVPPNPYYCTKCMAEQVQEAAQEPDDKAASIRWQLCLLAQTEEFSDDVRNQIGRGVWLIDRLCAALAEPQEPVAYSVGRTLHWHEGKGVSDAQLFAAPPQRKPLPASEIVTMYDESPRGDSDMIAFARAVERAHGIRGQA